MGANRKLIKKFAKSYVVANDGQKLRKDVMSKTLIRLLKKFVMNANGAENNFTKESPFAKDIGMFTMNVRQLTS